MKPDPFEELHQEYIKKTTDTGQPVWMINQLNTQPDERKTQHQKDSDQSLEVTTDSDDL